MTAEGIRVEPLTYVPFIIIALSPSRACGDWDRRLSERLEVLEKALLRVLLLLLLLLPPPVVVLSPA